MMRELYAMLLALLALVRGIVKPRGAIEIDYAQKLVQYLENVIGMPVDLEDEGVYVQFWYTAQISLYYAVAYAHHLRLEDKEAAAEALQQAKHWWDAAHGYCNKWQDSEEPWSSVAYLGPNPFLTAGLIMITEDAQAWNSDIDRSNRAYRAAGRLWEAMRHYGWDKVASHPCSSSENNAGYGSLAALCWRQFGVNDDDRAEAAWVVSRDLLRGTLSLSDPETLIYVECEGGNCEQDGYFQVWNRGCPSSGYLTPNYAGDAVGFMNYAILARRGEWYANEFGSVYKWWGWSGSTLDVGVVSLNQESYIREACDSVFDLPTDKFPTVEACSGSKCAQTEPVIVDEWGTHAVDKMSYALAFEYWRALNKFGSEHELTRLVSAHYDMICALMQYRTRFDQVIMPYHMPGTTLDWHRLIVSCAISYHSLAAAVNYELCQ